jgi:hypothetical protein
METKESSELRDKYQSFRDAFAKLDMLDTMKIPLGCLCTQGSDDGKYSYSHGQLIRAKWSEPENTIWVVDGNHRVWEMQRNKTIREQDPELLVLKVPHFDWEINEEAET